MMTDDEILGLFVSSTGEPCLVKLAVGIKPFITPLALHGSGLATAKVKMAEIFNSTGVITKTSNDFCVVSISINGLSKSFSFYKSLFYTFGVQCDGSMTNILEEGMEVELCYKISHPGTEPCIAAVWLGDKPDILSEDNGALSAIYDKIGRVLGSVDNENFLVQLDPNDTVLINKEVAFRDGSFLKDDVVVDEQITFDAIPFDFEHPSGASYQATCAWIGLKPKLVDRFQLRSVEDDCWFPGEEIVHGTVAVIPNDVVALVDVAFESMLIKVLLFRRSFNRSCERIADEVDIGDKLDLHLGSGYIFPGRRQWFAIKAFKTSNEVDVNFCDLHTADHVVVPEMTESTPGTGFEKQPPVQSAENCEFLYNQIPQSGVISGLSDASGACITYKNFKIFVKPDNFYMYREPCTLCDFLRYVKPGTNTACFHAVKAKFLEPEKCEFTHEATCAWVGHKPSIAGVAKSLPPVKLSLLDEKGKIFYGVVRKFLFPSVAFAIIPEESTTVVIHCGETNFVTRPQRPPESDSEKPMIANYVKLNDYVQFIVRQHPQVRFTLTAYDLCPVSLTQETRGKIKSGVSLSGGPSEKPIPKNPSLKEQKKLSEPPALTTLLDKVAVETQTQPSTTSMAIARLSDKCLSQNRGHLLNCSGKLKVTMAKKTVVVEIEHIFGTSTVNGHAVYFPSSLSVKKMLKYNNRQVRFDAEFAMSPNTNEGFRVIRMWEIVRPASECLLASELVCRKTDIPRIRNIGKIESIPFHDSAIARVDSVRVFIPLSSVITVEQVNPYTSSIETVLSIGDSVLVFAEKCPLQGYAQGLSYFRASLCVSLQPGQHPENNFETTVLQRKTTRSDIWGLGEYYRKELVLYKAGRYFVKFLSSRRSNLELSLDLFEKGKVFINNKLATPEMLESYVRTEITFHVAHEHPNKLSSDGKGMFVACAWIGPEPSPRLMFEEVIATPKGSICPTGRYEAVVRSFPLPFYALCFIGYVPVLVLVLAENEGVENLKLGDIISIIVHEESYRNYAYVYSKDLKNLKLASVVEVKDVYRNLTGTVVVLPEPVGKIKAADADIEVSFELCHLRRLREDPDLSNREWFASVREKITVGKQVYFSAQRNPSKSFKNVPYRAFEVYFVE